MTYQLANDYKCKSMMGAINIETFGEITIIRAVYCFLDFTKVGWLHSGSVDIDAWDYGLCQQGDLYVLDRHKGKPLTEVVRKAVPSGRVGPSERPNTQPFSSAHSLARTWINRT